MIEIDPEMLPLDVLRWPGKWTSLMSIAAAVGGGPFALPDRVSQA
jgi:hypothetical protein